MDHQLHKSMCSTFSTYSLHIDHVCLFKSLEYVCTFQTSIFGSFTYEFILLFFSLCPPICTRSRRFRFHCLHVNISKHSNKLTCFRTPVESTVYISRCQYTRMCFNWLRFVFYRLCQLRHIQSYLWNGPLLIYFYFFLEQK